MPKKENFCCFCSKILFPYMPCCNPEGVKRSSKWRSSCRHYDDFMNNKPLQPENHSVSGLKALFVPKEKHCFICFSDNHKTKNCNEKLSNFFSPNIDNQLLPRFMQMIDGIEQYAIAFSSKEAFEMFPPKPLIVAKNVTLYGRRNILPNFENSNILITESFRINELSSRYEECGKLIYDRLFPAITSKTFIVHAKVIKLSYVDISAANFFQLLSPKTIVLECFIVTISPAGICSKIIKMIPNIEKISFKNSSIKFDILWITNFMTNCKALKSISVAAENVFIAPECLPVVIKKNDVIIDLNGLRISDPDLLQKLSSFCIKISDRWDPLQELYIRAEKMVENEESTKPKFFKRILMRND